MIPFTRAKYDKETGRGFNVPREQVTNFFVCFRWTEILTMRTAIHAQSLLRVTLKARNKSSVKLI